MSEEETRTFAEWYEAYWREAREAGARIPPITAVNSEVRNGWRDGNRSGQRDMQDRAVENLEITGHMLGLSCDEIATLVKGLRTLTIRDPETDQDSGEGDA